MIEVWGRGIRGMIDTCREVGNPTPEWRVEAGGDGLSVTFPFSKAYMAADAAARGGVVPTTTPKTAQIPETARKQPETEDANRSLAGRIVAFLRENPSASRRLIAEARSGATEGSVRYQLDKLKRVNRLRRVGPDRGGRWLVLDGDDDGQPPENSQKPAATARKQPEAEDSGRKLADRILAALRQDPSASRRELAAMLGTTEATVRYRLDKLRAEGKIERVGPDKGGRWRVLDVAHTEDGPQR